MADHNRRRYQKGGRDIATVVVLVAADFGWSPIPSVELLHEGMFPIDRFDSMRDRERRRA